MSVRFRPGSVARQYLSLADQSLSSRFCNSPRPHCRQVLWSSLGQRSTSTKHQSTTYRSQPTARAAGKESPRRLSHRTSGGRALNGRSGRDTSQNRVSLLRGPSNSPAAAPTPKSGDPKSTATSKPAGRAAVHQKNADTPTQEEHWRVHKEAMEKKLGGQAWNPKKKLSPDAMEGVRALHASHPDHFTTPVLADYFSISPEAIRRILKSKWQPATTKQERDRIERWNRRGQRIWSALVAKGVHAPKKWRAQGIGTGPRRPRQLASRTMVKEEEPAHEASVNAPHRTRPGGALFRSLASRL